MKRKPCPICGKNIIGRSDKKFCGPSCKNKFHHPSQYNKGQNIKTVNKFLFDNYRIIASIFKGEKNAMLTVPRMLLDKMGFHFKYCTGVYVNSQNKLYHYIYDYAWMEFSSQEVMLVKKKEGKK